MAVPRVHVCVCVSVGRAGTMPKRRLGRHSPGTGVGARAPGAWQAPSRGKLLDDCGRCSGMLGTPPRAPLFRPQMGRLSRLVCVCVLASAMAFIQRQRVCAMVCAVWCLSHTASFSKQSI